MRIPLVYVVSAALLLASSCSRDKPATPATAPAAAPTAAATPAAAAPAAAPKQQVFGVEELDQMVAPIALYPDSLLAQVVMAATYPGDVADAAKWSKAHPDAKGDAACVQPFAARRDSTPATMRCSARGLMPSGCFSHA